MKKKIILSDSILDSFESDKEYPPIPDIVYHGQPPSYENGKEIEPEIITKFDQNKRRYLEEKHVGFYFTDKKHIAQEYARSGNLYTCKLHIKNPYYFTWTYYYSGKGLIKSPAFITHAERDVLFKNGFDSVIQLDMMKNFENIVVFDPDKIQILKVN